MRNQRNALVYLLVSWLARRWLKKRTATVTGIAGNAAGRGRVRGAIGAIAALGVIAGAFLAWRKLAGSESTDEAGRWEAAVDVAPGPAPAEPTPA
jgi:hypothetical protein